LPWEEEQEHDQYYSALAPAADAGDDEHRHAADAAVIAVDHVGMAEVVVVAAVVEAAVSAANHDESCGSYEPWVECNYWPH